MTRVVDNPAQSRFELTRDGRTSELVYAIEGVRMLLHHTGVPKAQRRNGIGGELVRAAVHRAARDRLTVVPRCPFARWWFEKHPHAANAVAIDWETTR